MIMQSHVDDISRMSEEELGKAYRQCTMEMSTLRRNKGSQDMLKYAEEEFCYLFREVEIRDRRRVAHEKWTRKFQGPRRKTEFHTKPTRS